jgi:hypothetical protein
MRVYRDDVAAAFELAGALRLENEELRRSLDAVRATLEGPSRILPGWRRSFDLATAIGIVVSLLAYLAIQPKMIECSVQTTRTSARELRSAAETWRAMHDEPACPTPERLRHDKMIDSVSKLTDAWDRPFRVDCTPSETFASSVGPDGRPGTADDIIVPDIPPAL